MVGGAAPAGGGDAGADEGSSTKDVILASPGGQKIAVIKAVKDLLGLGPVSYTHLTLPTILLV